MRVVDSSDAVALEVSTDGGSSFSEIKKFWGVNTSGKSESFDVSAYISASTVFRFRVTDYYGGGDETFKMDNFKIEASSSSSVEGFVNIADVSADANGQTVTDSDPSEVVIDAPECDVCINGQSQVTLKVANWSSSRDQSETIRVREGGLGGALLFEGQVSNNGSFTFDMNNPGATIVITVQGYYHPSEYVKGSFVVDCDLMVNHTSGNSYIIFKVTDLTSDGHGGNCPVTDPVVTGGTSFSANLLTNGGFENGTNGWWKSDGYNALTSDRVAGNYAIMINKTAFTWYDIGCTRLTR